MKLHDEAIQSVAPSDLAEAKRSDRSVARLLAADSITYAVLALLVLTWCIEGALEVAGLPHRLDVAVDLTEVLLTVWLIARLVRARTLQYIPLIVVAYGAWVIAGLYTHAPAGAVVTSLRNFVLLPVLALLLAAEGTTERRARAFVTVLLTLATLEVGLTIYQGQRFSDADRIVGTFGHAANAGMAAVIVMTACAGVAGYLVGAPRGVAGLMAAIALPLFAAWAVVKLVPFLLPVAVSVITVLALLRRRTTWRRALTAIAVAALTGGLIIGYYAAYRPDNFAALFHTNARAKYLRTASIKGTTEGHVTGRLTQWRRANHEISASFGNELFGKGLGTATVAENLGVYPKDLSQDSQLASYSDFGTLLVERGWTGIAIVAFFALAFVATAWRILPFLPEGQWRTALTVAVPGAVCVMAAYGPFAEELRNAAAAVTFWLMIAFGLSAATFRGGIRRDGQPGRRNTN
jgi:hypothetical protein